MAAPDLLRRALFGAAVLALLAAVLALPDEQPDLRPAAGELRQRPAQTLRQPRGDLRGLRSRARCFLHAFLRYEVGAQRPADRKALSSTASRRFADALLGSPPRSRLQLPSRYRLGALRLVSLTLWPPRALVTATARRATGPEELAFVFARRGGRWLATSPGQ